MRCLLALGIAFALALGGCAAQAPADRLPALEVAIPKIGAADCIALVGEGGCVVIDAGEDDDGAELVRLLERYKVQKIDLLIITHFDKDHIGAAPALLERFAVETLLEPMYDMDTSRKVYRRYDDAAARAGERKAVTQAMQLDALLADMGVTIAVYPPLGAQQGDNDNSLAVTVTHGAVRMAFAGDAEQSRGEELLEQLPAGPYALLKAPHHGRYHEVSEALLTHLAPAILAITCSEKNPPEPAYLEAAGNAGVTAIRLSADGDILLQSDGERLR